MIFIIILFLITRLYNLSLIPITNDEANYIFWAKQVATTNEGWFITLTAGKPPIFLWLIVFFLKILPANLYLIAGRLPSVLSGLIALIGVYKLSNFLYSRKVAIIASLFFTLCPFVLFYDRLALYDSLLTATTIWSVYFMFKKNIFWWSITLGLALLSKPTAILYWALTPMLFLFLNGFKRQNLVSVLKVVFVSQLIHNVLIFSSGYHDYITRAFDYTSTNNQLIVNPIPLFQKNLIDSFFWLTTFVTAPLLALGLISFLRFPLFSILFVAPILILSLFGRIYFPRYFLLVLPYLLIPAAALAAKKPLLLVLVLALTIRFNYLLLTDPTKAPLPEIEDWQYVSGYPSSYGFEPIYKYIDNSQKNGPVTLFVQGSFSHFPHAFDLYFWGNPNVKIYERWPLTAIDQQMVDSKKYSQVYIVVRKNTLATENDPINELPLKILVEGKKPRGPDSVYLTTFD